MKQCPHCGLEIRETAIRCRHCRKSISGPARKNAVQELWGSARDYCGELNQCLAESHGISRPLLLIFLYSSLYFALGLFLERSELILDLVEELRSRYFIFVREPVLLSYAYIVLSNVIVKTGLVLVLILHIHFRKGLGLRMLRLRLSLNSKRWGFLCLFAVASCALGWFYGYDPLIPNLPVSFFFPESMWIGGLMAVLSIVFIAPITEEIMFRGFIYPGLAQKMGSLAGIVLTSVLFAAMHYHQLQGDWVLILNIHIVSFVITLARAMTGSTLYAILIHFIYNASILLSGYVFFSVL